MVVADKERRWEMSKLGSALQAFKAGNADAATVAALVKPGAKGPTGKALLQADAEDPDTEIVPETFDEVSLAYMKGDLDDAQYRDIVAAVRKNSAGPAGTRK
jgi:hypothetical protein